MRGGAPKRLLEEIRGNGPFRDFLSTLDLSRDAVTWYNPTSGT